MNRSALFLACTLALGGCSSIISATSEQPMNEVASSRTLGTIIDDESIETKSLVNISKASPALSQSHILVTSYNGVVLLAGQVPDTASRELAETVVKRLSKVRKVYNEISISGPTSHIVRVNDTWISAKVKTKMMANEKVSAMGIKVVTENGVVYLLGLISQEEAAQAVRLVQETHGVQKVVKMFEYID